MKATPLRSEAVSKELKRDSCAPNALLLVITKLVAKNGVDHDVDDGQVPADESVSEAIWSAKGA
jgi:hypothetical protein